MAEGYYGVQGGSGGGSSTFNQYTLSLERPGPTSYSTANGFVFDLSATYSAVNDFDLIVKKGTRGNLGIGRPQIVLDSPSAGQVTVRFYKHQYDRTSSTGTVQNQPSGVTVATSSGQVATSEATHVHAYDHDHPAFFTSAPIPAGIDSLLDALGGVIDEHIHEVNWAAVVADTAAGSSHNHTDNTLYAHLHSVTHTATNYTIAELTNGTNLSSTEFLCVASGVRI